MSLPHYGIISALNRAQERREHDRGVRKRFQGPRTVNTTHTILEAGRFEFYLSLCLVLSSRLAVI